MEIQEVVSDRIGLLLSRSSKRLSVLFLALATLVLLIFSGVSERNIRIANLEKEEEELRFLLLQAQSVIEFVREKQGSQLELDCRNADQTILDVLEIREHLLPALRSRLVRADLQWPNLRILLVRVGQLQERLSIINGSEGNSPFLRFGPQFFQPSSDCGSLTMKDLATFAWFVDFDMSALKSDIQTALRYEDNLLEGAVSKILDKVEDASDSRIIAQALIEKLKENAINTTYPWDLTLANRTYRNIDSLHSGVNSELVALSKRREGYVEVSLPGVPGKLLLREAILIAPAAIIFIVLLSIVDLRNALVLGKKVNDRMLREKLVLTFGRRTMGLYPEDWLILGNIILSIAGSWEIWQDGNIYLVTYLIALILIGLASAACRHWNRWLVEFNLEVPKS